MLSAILSARKPAHRFPCGHRTRGSRAPRTTPATFGTRRPAPQFPGRHQHTQQPHTAHSHATFATRRPAPQFPGGHQHTQQPRAAHTPCDLRHTQTRAAIPRRASAHAAAAHRAQLLRPSAHADPCRNSLRTHHKTTAEPGICAKKAKAPAQCTSSPRGNRIHNVLCEFN